MIVAAAAAAALSAFFGLLPCGMVDQHDSVHPVRLRRIGVVLAVVGSAALAVLVPMGI